MRMGRRMLIFSFTSINHLAPYQSDLRENYTSISGPTSGRASKANHAYITTLLPYLV